MFEYPLKLPGVIVMQIIINQVCCPVVSCTVSWFLIHIHLALIKSSLLYMFLSLLYARRTLRQYVCKYRVHFLSNQILFVTLQGLLLLLLRDKTLGNIKFSDWGGGGGVINPYCSVNVNFLIIVYMFNYSNASIKWEGQFLMFVFDCYEL